MARTFRISKSILQGNKGEKKTKETQAIFTCLKMYCLPDVFSPVVNNFSSLLFFSLLFYFFNSLPIPLPSF